MEGGYASIGDLLQRARRECGVTLEEAGKALHIRPHYLQALESGDLSQLPGSAYNRGYLQSYAIYLGLDRDEILRRFERVEPLMARRGFFHPQAFRAEKLPSPAIVWGALAAGVLVYLLWWIFHSSLGGIPLIEPFSPRKPENPAISGDFKRE